MQHLEHCEHCKPYVHCWHQCQCVLMSPLNQNAEEVSTKGWCYDNVTICALKSLESQESVGPVHQQNFSPCRVLVQMQFSYALCLFLTNLEAFCRDCCTNRQMWVLNPSGNIIPSQLPEPEAMVKFEGFNN